MSQGPLLFHDPVQMNKVSLLWMPQVREWLGLFSESHDPLLLSCSSAKSLYEASESWFSSCSSKFEFHSSHHVC